MRPHELKMLVIFDAIMTEGSITRAAQQLSMSQPAVSNAVASMRIRWKDELFVADGRNIQPTTYAQNLWAKVRDSIHTLNHAVEPNDFDPKTAKRTFRIALPDIVLDALWLDMRKLFEQEAPGLNLYAVPYTIGCTEQILNDADVDLVIGQSNRSLKNICTDHLFDTSYVCAMRKNHPLDKQDLSAAEFAGADHLLVSLSGDHASPADQALAQIGLKRRVAFTVNHFSSAAAIIEGSDLIAVLPTDLMYQSIGCDALSIVTVPVKVPHSSISMLWHIRQSSDEGLIWLRDRIKTILVERNEKEVKSVIEYFNLKRGSS